MARKNDGAPGIDAVTFEAIEARGVNAFLTGIQDELTTRTYVPLCSRRTEIPKDGGKVRVLSIPAIRDRVVQGALKLRDVFRRHRSQPVQRVIELINPILRGWVNYFAVGHFRRCFSFVQQGWNEPILIRHDCT